MELANPATSINHMILRPIVEDLCEKVAREGIDSCTEKDVTLLCFGMLAFNGMHDVSAGIDKVGVKVDKAVESVKGFFWWGMATSFALSTALILSLIFV